MPNTQKSNLFDDPKPKAKHHAVGVNTQYRSQAAKTQNRCEATKHKEMPNPYDDLFNPKEEENKNKPTPPQPLFNNAEFEADDRFEDDGIDALDEILASIQVFNQQAEAFSKLLSETRAIDHKVESGLLRFFFEAQDKHAKETLSGERKYHESLKAKFESIIAPMRDLAELHLQTIKQFNNDIDKNYFSVEKSDSLIKQHKTMAINGISLQRRILADATINLDILKNATISSERRIYAFVNIGGQNNLSNAEYEIIVQKRKVLTSGVQHSFNYTFFDVNLVDKTAISLGIYMKETTSQYLGNLVKAFEMR